MRGQGMFCSEIPVQRPTIMPVPDRYAAPNLPWPPPPENTPAEFTMLAEYQSEPARHPYRIYVGLFVAIVLGVLVYVTWRNNSAFWSSGNAPAALPQAVPAAKSEAPSAAEPPATSAATQYATSNPAETAPVGSRAEQDRPSQESRTRIDGSRENDRGERISIRSRWPRTRPARSPYSRDSKSSRSKSRCRRGGTEWLRRIGSGGKVFECRAGYGAG